MCYMSRSPAVEQPVGVRELRQNLSVYLTKLKTGTVFRVTERGRAVALLIPIPQHSTAVARLIASGRATAATRDLLRVGRAKKTSSRKPSDELQYVREDIV